MSLEFIGLFLFLAGFIVGLGAVTVIDSLGFCARNSTYFTLTTIRAHQITKPLIWLGMFLAILGGAIFYSQNPYSVIIVLQCILAIILIFNGLFLSFYVSPRLLQKEKEEKGNTKLLSKSMQAKIAVSFVISFIGWWTSVLLLVGYILST
ncbi:MAG: hypothetical protein KA035_02775 [Candidatus Levybacteria bacterium]|nr:hypothetical protein [Candidatus Levybacteria bacterium]